jgi:hypothetical protein
MDIYFSRHARRQLKWRKISHEEVREIILHPESETAISTDKVNLFGSIAGRSLKVVIKKEKERIVVITGMVKKRKG